MPLHVPLFLVNPIPLQYVDDDRHVIAFFSGHPQFECVEAVFSPRGDGTFSTRAILTRRDQTQIDFVNDTASLTSELGLERTMVLRNIGVTLDEREGLPVTEVQFESHENELVVLRVACGSPPDPSRGGVTDPGSHALGSSLPLMLRRASALAGPSSSVHIAGIRYPIPEMFRKGPHFVAHHGYYTQGFHMAAIRNGSRSLRILRQPSAFRVGEQWEYEMSSGKLIYEIQSRENGRTLRIVSSAKQVETVYAVATARGLVLSKIALQAFHTQSEGTVVSFGQSNGFSVRVDAHADVVSGSTFAPDANSLTLEPKAPAWAIPRAVHIRWALKGDVVTLETACGAAPMAQTERHRRATRPASPSGVSSI
jgi:hypothetical protein